MQPKPSRCDLRTKLATNRYRLLILIGSLNRTNMLKHATFLDSVCSRVPGYPGFYAVASYTRDRFVEYGLSDVHYENYASASPVGTEGSLTMVSPETRVMKLYPMWPMSPSPTPIEGEAPLIDCRLSIYGRV